MKSAKYEIIKRYYDQGLWSIIRVRNAVTKGRITEEEYNCIVNGEAEEETETEAEAEMETEDADA